jgi:ABC-2 type transport system permease protein
VSLFVVATVRTLIGMVPAALLAIPLYHFSIFDMGWALIAFFFNLLIFGSAIGIAMSGMVLRWGLGAESLCWAGIFLIAPLSGVYYPISVLPGWLQPVALALPSAHVFEGMRAVLIDGVMRWDHLWLSIGLNAVYLFIGFGLFLLIFRDARSRGTLLQMGE